MEAVQLTVSMKPLGPYAEKNYQSTSRMEEWVLPDKRQEYLKKTQKISTICNSEVRQYPLHQMGKRHTLSGFGLDFLSRFETKLKGKILNIQVKCIGSEHRTAIFPKPSYSKEVS